MNKLTQIFLVLFMICLPVTLWADNDKDDDDSRYLAGAVPEVDGRVVFSREFSIPGMSQDEIYERMLKWLDGRMKYRTKTIAGWYIKKKESSPQPVKSGWYSVLPPFLWTAPG